MSGGQRWESGGGARQVRGEAGKSSRQNKSRALSPEQALAVPTIARGGGAGGRCGRAGEKVRVHCLTSRSLGFTRKEGPELRESMEVGKRRQEAMQAVSMSGFPKAGVDPPVPLPGCLLAARPYAQATLQLLWSCSIQVMPSLSQLPLPHSIPSN